MHGLVLERLLDDGLDVAAVDLAVVQEPQALLQNRVPHTGIQQPFIKHFRKNHLFKIN